MPKRVPNASVVVIRDKKRVSVTPGKAFDFTAAEIDEITRIMPGALRKPVNESADTATSETAPDANAKATATKSPKKAPAKAKKASTPKVEEQASEAETDEDEEEEEEDTDAEEESEDEDI